MTENEHDLERVEGHAEAHTEPGVDAGASGGAAPSGSGMLAELAAARAELEGARAALAASERRRELERALLEAGAVDVEAGVLLAEASMGVPGGAEAGVAGAVGRLRRTRGWLFAGGSGEAGASAGAGGGVMGEREELDEAGDALGRLADRAGASGDRRSVLAYLRAKRVAG